MYYMYICIFAYMSTYINDTCICVYVCMYILSHENKKSLNLVHFIIKKTFLIANECKTLHSFSIKNIFHDKMDLRLFYFHVTICMSYYLPIYVSVYVCI